MSALVDRTSPRQREVALIRANEQRSLGRQWKQQVGSMPARQARQAASRVLLDAPETVGGLTVHQFLVAIPRMGDEKVRRMLSNRAQGWYIWPFRRVRELTLRQRVQLAAELAR